MTKQQLIAIYCCLEKYVLEGRTTFFILAYLDRLICDLNDCSDSTTTTTTTTSTTTTTTIAMTTLPSTTVEEGCVIPSVSYFTMCQTNIPGIGGVTNGLFRVYLIFNSTNNDPYSVAYTITNSFNAEVKNVTMFSSQITALETDFPNGEVFDIYIERDDNTGCILTISNVTNQIDCTDLTITTTSTTTTTTTTTTTSTTTTSTTTDPCTGVVAMAIDGSICTSDMMSLLPLIAGSTPLGGGITGDFVVVAGTAGAIIGSNFWSNAFAGVVNCRYDIYSNGKLCDSALFDVYVIDDFEIDVPDTIIAGATLDLSIYLDPGVPTTGTWMVSAGSVVGSMFTAPLTEGFVNIYYTLGAGCLTSNTDIISVTTTTTTTTTTVP